MNGVRKAVYFRSENGLMVFTIKLPIIFEYAIKISTAFASK